ncbi:LLM class F420-dependent oxidoreductase [Microbacterium sp. E-13]|uniref:LLM class F420-dependent oxidoreductase n=1 Tax=Microbacterium sp. E-13 TaxID=3404048 RepID=UPI003CF1B57E
MRFGIHFMNFAFPGGPAAIASTLGDTARAADEAGASWFTCMDHYFQMEQVGGHTAPMLEGYTSLGYVAAHTTRVRLGLLVTGVTYRPPGLLAKIVTALDVLSGGRAMLGLGAAWYEREHRGLGVPYPPIAERFERLEETLQIVEQMWSDDDGPFVGAHYRLDETLNVPQPLGRPYLIIGGSGEKKTLRLVARYADACNLFTMGQDAVRAKLEVLARHCEAEGRDPDTIEKTILFSGDVVAEPDAFLREMERYAALGIDHVQLALTPAVSDPAGYVRRAAESVVPRLATV